MTKDTIGVVAVVTEVCGLLYFVKFRSRTDHALAVRQGAVLVGLLGFIMFLAPDNPTTRSVIYIVWAIALVMLLRGHYLTWRETKKTWQARKEHQGSR